LFGLAQQPSQQEVKSLQAKKLDINFDADDFFNSFQPAPVVAAPIIASAIKHTTKLQEVDDPFDMKPKPTPSSTTMSFGTSLSSANQSDLDLQAQERLRQLGNKKGISSKDVFGEPEKKSEEVTMRYQQLAGAKAISSDMFFGNKKEPGSAGKDLGEDVEGYIMGRTSNTSNNSYDEYKETAIKIAEKVTDQAKVYKDKALDWFNNFSRA
jgi:hypothetical protein